MGTMTSTKGLRFDAKTGQFTGKLKDVKLIPICALSLHRGVRLVSDETGKQAVFAQQWTELDAEGNVVVMHLTPTKLTKEAIPELRGTKILLVA